MLEESCPELESLDQTCFSPELDLVLPPDEEAPEEEGNPDSGFCFLGLMFQREISTEFSGSTSKLKKKKKRINLDLNDSRDILYQNA